MSSIEVTKCPKPKTSKLKSILCANTFGFLPFCFWHFFFLHFRQCPSIRKLGQSIDPFEVISHQSTPFSFLQCYYECKLNEQKDKELRGWTPKSCGNLINLNVLSTCESTSSVWLWSSSLNLCSFPFFQFSILKFELILSSRVEKGFGKLGQNLEVYIKIFPNP